MEKNRLSKTPVYVSIAGREPIPATPAYCVTTSVLVGYRPAPNKPSSAIGSLGKQGVTDKPAQDSTEIGGTFKYSTDLDWVVSGGYAGFSFEFPSSQQQGGIIPVYKDSTTCYPAVQGVAGKPPTLVKVSNGSWADGGFSLPELEDGKIFTTNVCNSPVAILIGISPAGEAHSKEVVMAGLVVRAFESTPSLYGEEVEAQALEVIPNSIQIKRHNGLASFYVNGLFVFEVDYPQDESAHLVVLLFDDSDYVYNPTIKSVINDGQEGGIASFRMQTLLLSDDLDYMGRIAVSGLSLFEIQTTANPSYSLPDNPNQNIFTTFGESAFRMQSDAFALAGYSMSGVSVALSANYVVTNHLSPSKNTAFGGASYSALRFSNKGIVSFSNEMKAEGFWPKYKGKANGFAAERSPVSLSGVYPLPSLNAKLSNGGRLATNEPASMKFAARIASNNNMKGDGKAFFKVAASGWFDWLDSQNIIMHEVLEACDNFNFNSISIFSFLEETDIGSFIDIFAIAEASFIDGIVVGDEFSLGALIEFVFNDGVIVDYSAATVQREAIQYATNVITGALGRYENFDFKQFAATRNGAYAITSTGLYSLSGDTDSGQAISAMIDFGASDYGSKQKKRVSSAYLYLNTDGNIFVKLAADGNAPQVYELRSERHSSRVTTAKGIAATQWRVRLEIADASMIDLDAIEIEIGVSQRRL